MKLTIESTEEFVQLNGRLTARIWNGCTESGQECTVFVVDIAVPRNGDCSEFERDLIERKVAQ